MFTIHAVTEADAAPVAGLLSELGYPCDPGGARSRIARACADPNTGFLLAVDAGQVKGLVAYHTSYYLPEDSLICRITALVVAETARRAGVARQLVETVADAARTRGCSALEVTTALARHDAQHFYAACGFQMASQRYLRRLRPSGAKS